jgi:DNA-binding transcriptional LysR family regulator
VPVALARLTAEHPELKADVVEGTTDELVAHVRSGAAHVSLCFQDAELPRREHEGAARVEVEREAFRALLPAAHRLAGRGPIRLADLAAETWVAPSREGLIARACEAAGFTPAIRYVSRDPLANRGMVASGLAVTISPARLAAEFHGIAVEPLRDGPCRDVYALLPAAGAAPLARAFVEAVTATSARAA